MSSSIDLHSIKNKTKQEFCDRIKRLEDNKDQRVKSWRIVQGLDETWNMTMSRKTRSEIYKMNWNQKSQRNIESEHKIDHNIQQVRSEGELWW